ncbi:MAG: hypothetical protein JXK07_13445 [Spirochaetes bacterium]|nr:hypothetical protein [Spirochaetota bacterium]
MIHSIHIVGFLLLFSVAILLVSEVLFNLKVTPISSKINTLFRIKPSEYGFGSPTKVGSTFLYPSNMDKECVALCNSLNSLQGIETIYSCSGHSNSSLSVTFKCTSQVSLSKVVKQSCQWQENAEWNCDVSFLNNEMIYTLSTIEKGEQAFLKADEFATTLNGIKNV